MHLRPKTSDDRLTWFIKWPFWLPVLCVGATGRFATLRDVVEHYHGFFKLQLDDKQTGDLVEYLKSLKGREGGRQRGRRLRNRGRRGSVGRLSLNRRPSPRPRDPELVWRPSLRP